MKLWLTLVAGDNSLEDLKELWEPIKAHFDGICAVCHADTASEEAIYLQLEKKKGRIIYAPYVGRHDMSRNMALHCGVIQPGDLVCQFDCLERLSSEFAAHIRDLVFHLPLIDAFYYYGKIFLYRYHESIIFQGTPHEAWRRQDKQPVVLELSKAYPNEADVRLNVRPKKRDQWHFVDHYLGYYVRQPWGANHCLLGLDKNGDVSKLFPEREGRRLQFRDELRRRGSHLTVTAVKLLMDNGIPDDLKPYFREEKILNDAYRFHVLKKRDFTDNHDFKDMVEIP